MGSSSEGEVVGRRGFISRGLRYGATVALALAVTNNPFIKSAYSLLDKGDVGLVWIQGATDSGCSISLLNTVYPDVIDLLGGALPEVKIDLLYHATLMPSFGDDAISRINPPKKGFVLAVEGGVPTRDGGVYCTQGEVGGRPVPVKEWVEKLSEEALAVVAIGDCATHGGIPASAPNPSSVVGVLKLLGDGYTSQLGLPVINVTGCPPHPDWMVGALASAVLAAGGLLPPPKLDAQNRPLEFFQRRVHDDCPRRGYYDTGVFAKKHGDKECLFKLGCKGPITYADCNSRKWNNGLTSCVISGCFCIGCTEPGFPEQMQPFFEPLTSPPMTIRDAAGVGVALGAVLAGAYLARTRRKKG